MKDRKTPQITQGRVGKEDSQVVCYAMWRRGRKSVQNYAGYYIETCINEYGQKSSQYEILDVMSGNRGGIGVGTRARVRTRARSKTRAINRASLITNNKTTYIITTANTKNHLNVIRTKSERNQISTCTRNIPSNNMFTLYKICLQGTNKINTLLQGTNRRTSSNNSNNNNAVKGCNKSTETPVCACFYNVFISDRLIIMVNLTINQGSNLVRVAPDCNRSYCEDSFSGYSGSV